MKLKSNTNELDFDALAHTGCDFPTFGHVPNIIPKHNPKASVLASKIKTPPPGEP